MAETFNFNLQYDLSPVLLWQYQNAPIITGMVNSEQTFMNTAITEFWQSVNKDILNIQTCNSDGLAMWGQLLGVPRPTYQQGTETVSFTDQQYRLLLQARIYLLTFNGSVAALNQFFYILFPNYDVQIVDNYDMTVTINIGTKMTPEIAVLFQSPFVDTFLPRPSGVEYIINTERDYTKVFGFEGMVDENGDSVAGFGPDTGTYDPETSPGGTFYQ